MNLSLDSRLIDRLIDGELDPTERRETLIMIESTPGSWRQCALAFLESQEFSSAAKHWAIEHAAPPTASPVPAIDRIKNANSRRLVLAASVGILAFLAGFAVRGRTVLDTPTGIDREIPSIGTTHQSSDMVKQSKALEELQTVPAPAVIPAYVRSQWESQGYQIEQKRKLISMDLDGGGQVSIPFDDVEFRFVGRPIY